MFLILLLVLCFLPGIIAGIRQHPNRWAIFWTNLLLGWTIAGWVFAFIWSFTNPPQLPKGSP